MPPLLKIDRENDWFIFPFGSRITRLYSLRPNTSFGAHNSGITSQFNPIDWVHTKSIWKLSWCNKISGYNLHFLTRSKDLRGEDSVHNFRNDSKLNQLFFVIQSKLFCDFCFILIRSLAYIYLETLECPIHRAKPTTLTTLVPYRYTKGKRIQLFEHKRREGCMLIYCGRFLWVR